MKPFDYEAVKNGAAFCDSLGNPGRILCHDLRNNTPLVIAVKQPNGNELIYLANYDGTGPADSFHMSPVKKTLYSFWNSDNHLGSLFSDRSTVEGCGRTVVTLTWEE